MTPRDELIEKMAIAIYQHWNFYSDDHGKTDWVKGGNSIRQDQARDYARSALSAIEAAGCTIVSLQTISSIADAVESGQTVDKDVLCRLRLLGGKQGE